MRKLLIVLMVVAMASFLFVGCMPGVTPGPEPEPVVPPGPTSTTPVIETIEGGVEVEGGIDLYSSDIQYINKDKAKKGILVGGFAPKYSKVQVYIDGIVVGTSTAYGGDEEFKVFISKTSLGADGEKTIYATATEIGLKESDPSIKYAFTLDTVAPKIVSVAAEVEEDMKDATLIVTCSEAINEKAFKVLDCIGLWDVCILGTTGFVGEENSPKGYDLVSPTVIELTTDYTTGLVEGNLIRVKYEPEYPTAWGGESSEDYVLITDLAGNELPYSVHYCYLELE